MTNDLLTNDESMPNAEYRMPEETPAHSASSICHSSFRHSSFIGHSSFVICHCLLLAGLASAGAPKEWHWQLSTERYKQLNVFERAQYDRAAKLLEDDNYAAAATEFEKFKVQFPESPALPSVLVLRGYCLHLGKFRNKAIKAYAEVLDYFADQPEAAAPATYFTGVAHVENGDIRKGLQVLKQMVDDPRYQKHMLAAGGLRRLADNYFENKEYDLAIKYWKQTVKDFGQTNPWEAPRARDNVTVYYIKNKEYASYNAWLLNDENKDKPEAHKWMGTNVIDLGRQAFAWNSGHYNNFQQKERTEAARACYEYFQTKKPWFEKTKDLWTYYDRAVTFLAQCYQDKKERDKVVEDAVTLIRTEQDKAQANNKYAWLVDRLREGGDYLRALYCAQLIADAPFAAYKQYEVYHAQSKWNEALGRLMDIEKMPNKEWAYRAMDQRARVYRENLGQYDKAIELYRQISQPPRTLWDIQDCYMRWGKLDEAITTLTEIENSFPTDAARAAWHKAHYYDQANQSKKAIAIARKILKAYKASPEASRAHQLLEKYGVPTGGGVFEGEQQ
jgi:tetratricopeptide (TPR) repeat protein